MVFKIKFVHTCIVPGYQIADKHVFKSFKRYLFLIQAFYLDSKNNLKSEDVG